MKTVDDLIKEYADKLRNDPIGEYTYEGLLAKFAREVIEIVAPQEDF